MIYLLWFFFICSKNFFSIKVFYYLCTQNSIFKSFNHKNFLSPVRSVRMILELITSKNKKTSKLIEDVYYSQKTPAENGSKNRLKNNMKNVFIAFWKKKRKYFHFKCLTMSRYNWILSSEIWINDTFSCFPLIWTQSLGPYGHTSCPY